MKFLNNSKSVERSAYLWNTASAMLNAFQTVFILMVISRIDPVVDAGVFTIAFAVGNLMMTIGKYGIRNFQVSDVIEKYSFKEYWVFRILTSILMIIVSIVYVGYNVFYGLYNMEKSIVIILICLAKGIDAFEDVLHGMFQQNGRLDIAGKILTIRLASYIVVYMAVYFATHDLIITSCAALIVSVILFLLLDFDAVKAFRVANKTFSSANTLKLLKESLPLFIASYLVMYIGNAPKYAIDKVLTSEAQACFNYIFMPVFVIGLLSQFVYQPVINRMALLWQTGEDQKFGMIILRQIVIILGLSVVVVLGGHLLGIPALSLLYGVDLQKYRMELVVLLVSGGMLAFVNFFQMIITVARYQKYLLFGYVLAYLLFILLGPKVVKYYGIMGISVFYAVVVAGIALIFAAVTCVIIRQKRLTERCK